MDNGFRHVARSLDVNNIELDVAEMVKLIRPNWSPEKFQIKIFTDGITNKLAGVHVGDMSEMILVRIYGEKTELFIDRQVEKKTMAFLHAHGCAKQIYCSFDNGLCYGFVLGTVFDSNMMKDEYYSGLVAKELARFHTLPVPENYSPGQTRSSYFLQFHHLLEQLPSSFSDPAQNKRFREEVMSLSELGAAVDELEAVAQDFHEELVLCHHDLLIKNLIYTPDEDRVYFIDFEYAGLSYAAVDIGNHFAEYAGVDEIDFSLYPSREHQKKFLRVYLTERARYRGDPDVTAAILEARVATLYKQVNKMALMAHLFWGLWGVIQASVSTIDFDFLDYAIKKLNEYKNRKSEFLAL